MHILFIGEVMAEISSQNEGFQVSFAGDSFNSAVYCRRLLPRSERVSYLTRLGADPLSNSCKTFAKAHEVDLIAKQPESGEKLGIYAISNDESGERSFAYWRADSAARDLFSDPAEFDALGDADIIFLSGISLAILSTPARKQLFDHLARLRKKGARIAFDSNYRESLWQNEAIAREAIARAWRSCDIALPSLDDELALFGGDGQAAVLERLAEHGVKTGALKRGRSGPWSIDMNLSAELVPVDTPVDTTAAGDSFNAGYLAALAKGLGPDMRLAWGHNLACQVIMRRGAIVQTEPMEVR